MVLFTKEVFVQLKSVTTIYINCLQNDNYDNTGKLQKNEVWQVFIQGVNIDAGANGMHHLDSFQTYITCHDRADAQRLYNELMKQVSESGEVEKLNDKLFHDVLKEEVHA